MKESTKKRKVNQIAGLRLNTKAPAIFVDRKKENNKKACRGKVKYDSTKKK
jgi:hypothetical protein